MSFLKQFIPRSSVMFTVDSNTPALAGNNGPGATDIKVSRFANANMLSDISEITNQYDLEVFLKNAILGKHLSKLTREPLIYNLNKHIVNKFNNTPYSKLILGEYDALAAFINDKGLTEQQYTTLNNMLLKTETFTRKLFIPLLYNLARQHVNVSLIDVSMLQCKITDNFVEYWSRDMPKFEQHPALSKWGEDSYLSSFDYSNMKILDVVAIIAGSIPITINCPAVYKLAYNMTLMTLPHYNNIMELDTVAAKMSSVDIISMLKRMLPQHRYEDIDRLDNMVKHALEESKSIFYKKIQLEDWSPESDIINMPTFSLEADDGDEAEEPAEGDDTDDTDGSDDTDDSGNDDDTGGDDTGDDDTGDDGSDDSEDSDDGGDDSSTDDESSDDDGDEKPKEEPKKSPNINTSDSKGLVIEFSKGETYDSILFRIELENQIVARLKDGSLNNIQITILKQLKNYWLHYWSVETILNLMKLVEEMGNKQ